MAAPVADPEKQRARRALRLALLSSEEPLDGERESRAPDLLPSSGVALRRRVVNLFRSHH
jgi:hypothetical protein